MQRSTFIYEGRFKYEGFTEKNKAQKRMTKQSGKVNKNSENFHFNLNMD